MPDPVTLVRWALSGALNYSSTVAGRVADVATVLHDELVMAAMIVYPQGVVQRIEETEWFADAIPDHLERRDIDGIAMIVHKEEVCHPPCPIHAPSDHHMVEWPLFWRSDRGIFERGCPHNIGHPDPDTITYLLSMDPNGDNGVHGCDGCCRTREHG